MTNLDEIIVKTIPKNPIYYALYSTTSCLTVFCNVCDHACSFAYYREHNTVAYWTIGKEQIVCPQCAKRAEYKDIIYRKVFIRGDLPFDRSSYKLVDSPYLLPLFTNHLKNKKNKAYLFCTEKDEQNEFQMDRPPTEQPCKCPKCNHE